MEPVDLHMHSVHSDGSLSCGRLAEEASRVGVKLAALTDHNFTGGLDEFAREAKARSIAVLTGIELEGMLTDTVEAHVLAYAFDPASPALRAHIKRVAQGRAKRNERILNKLRSLGLNISGSLPDTDPGALSRTHFAHALVETGRACNMGEAFKLYLGRNTKAYFNYDRPHVSELIRLIKDTGGISVLAHPFKLRTDVNKALSELSSMGLGGVEAYYPDHTPAQINILKNYARTYGLRITCGSDFHGAYRNGVEIACCFAPDPALDFWYELAII